MVAKPHTRHSRYRVARESTVASRAKRYEAKQLQAERDEALRQNALTVCAWDDALMDLAVIASGLVAQGARTCTIKRFDNLVLDRPVIDKHADKSLLSTDVYSLTLQKSLAATNPSYSICSALSVIWANALAPTSDTYPHVVSDYGQQELGLFASRKLEVGRTLEGPVFVLVQTEDDQEGLNTLMQFEDGSRTWVGCGPARLINHSCRPNVRWLKRSYSRKDARWVKGCLSVVLEVILPIKPGEQLYASYGEGYFGQGYARCLCPHHPDRRAPSFPTQVKLAPPAAPPARIIIDLTVDEEDNDDDDFVLFVEHKRSQIDNDVAFVTCPLQLPQLHDLSTTAPIKSDPGDMSHRILTSPPGYTVPPGEVVCFEVSPPAPSTSDMREEAPRGMASSPEQLADRPRPQFDLEAYLSSSSRRFMGFPTEDRIIDLSGDG